ncbi:MAG: elongation factor G [Candidatus Thiodiazotropha lotti]|uniref:Elongation factor G n=1 Tax=Candidatus Thiodiazotropha lotti TaxID=2792787 RepID=A0A9E4K2Z8_9GAMM|nr:elongation factor G [Candidatus Thiodiazotropha lotti]ODB94774.1 translation elongation factor G [Candidatus Thiodiazotropha endoloripes]MCG7922967.1 elongation factor G [Candidatus Thiodiazotropha lotti]MCG7937736.1 elongation factor G [Candidatus Thiodiazotropha lotti]MCG7988746.1 elongation factor G [Candidatus Thiodiazotropha lotti]
MSSADFSIDQIRNIGLIAHIDAGKTTTTERMLYYCGRTRQVGSVDDGTTITDWMDQERERGITIVAASVTALWQDCQINLIDTPGHIDFTAEVQRALRVLDGAVVVFDASQGVEPQSETVWRQADKYRVPRICFINKMDRLGAEFEKSVESIRKQLSANPVGLQLPIGAESEFQGVIDLINMQSIVWQESLDSPLEYQDIPPELNTAAQSARNSMIEAIAEVDDQLLSLWLENAEVTESQIKAALRRATISNSLTPVLCGSAFKNKAVQPLLDAIVDYLPSPVDVGSVTGVDPKSDKVIERDPDPESPLSALIFKTVTDPYAGRLCYVRVYSGVLQSGANILNPRHNRPLRVGRLERMYAEHREDIKQIGTGDIAALLGLKETVTGDTLCAVKQPLLLEAISFPEPVIKITISPMTAQDNDKLANALQQLAEDDPTFKFEAEKETGQTLLGGMGELHLEVVLERLKREHGVTVRTGMPKVAYKETINRPVKNAEGRFIRQTGGHGQYGHVVISLTPDTSTDGVIFENSIKAGAIPAQFIPAIEEGITESSRSGVISGYPVTGIKVSLIDGSYHEMDSTPLSFKVAAGMAFRSGLESGNPTLLEPVVNCNVITPEEHLGDVLAQLANRRAEIEGISDRPGGIKSIHNLVPLSEMFGYATELRSATHGRGTFTMEFDHYAAVSKEIMRTMGR